MTAMDDYYRATRPTTEPPYVTSVRRPRHMRRSGVVTAVVGIVLLAAGFLASPAIAEGATWL